MTTLSQDVINELAECLDNAEINRAPITKITDDHPDMDWEDAYAVQTALRQRKLDAGHQIAGMKMGFTSRAKMQQMGVDDPVYGFLTDYGSCPDGGMITVENLIHPRIEAEIAFVTKAILSGPGCHIGDVFAATDFVVPAVEILDSRYKDFKFDLKSVIADNTSAAKYVTGGRMRRPEDLDLRNEGVVVEKNGQIIGLGAGAAVLGNPAESVAMLANMLAKRGEVIPAGTFIATGGITAAVAVEKGDSVTARYQHLGSLTMTFV